MADDDSIPLGQPSPTEIDEPLLHHSLEEVMAQAGISAPSVLEVNRSPCQPPALPPSLSPISPTVPLSLGIDEAGSSLVTLTIPSDDFEGVTRSHPAEELACDSAASMFEVLPQESLSQVQRNQEPPVFQGLDAPDGEG